MRHQRQASVDHAPARAELAAATKRVEASATTAPLSSPEQIPLGVDLDGTLVRSDLLIESGLMLLKRSFWYIFLLPFWLARGKAYLKHCIAERVELEVALLPYQREFLAYLKEQRSQGRRLILATAAHTKFARQIADHLGLFDTVLATNERENLCGQRKLEKLLELCGVDGFDYAANAKVDLPIWQHARRALVVNPRPGVTAAAAKVAQVERVFQAPRAGLRIYGRALRLHQWLKNILVFVPLIAAHQVTETALLWQSAVAFLAFGLCASSVYLLNDLLDLEADRRHPRKRQRAFATGALDLSQGLLLIPLLLAGAFALGLTLPPTFPVALAGYYLLTLAYSLYLKQKVMVDVVVLALLYTSRIVAGVAAISGIMSFWLLGFSIFFFLSLAIVKRHAELQTMLRLGRNKAHGRGYQTDDLAILQSLGTASGYISVLVLALYINNPDINRLYTYPEGLWLLCLLVLYWISRVWLITHRGAMHDDPVIFAIKDPVSRMLGIAIALIVWLSS